MQLSTQSERLLNDGQQVGEPSAVLGTALITYMCTCIRTRMYVYMYVGQGQELRIVLTWGGLDLQPVWVGTVAWVPLNLCCLARPTLVGSVPTDAINLHTTHVG